LKCEENFWAGEGYFCTLIDRDDEGDLLGKGICSLTEEALVLEVRGEFMDW
jgi:hypothetical protein